MNRTERALMLLVILVVLVGHLLGHWATAHQAVLKPATWERAGSRWRA